MKFVNAMKFVWKYCKVWLIVSLAVILVFFSATMVATQNAFLSGTLDTVLGGEGRRNTSGNPDDYIYYEKSLDGFKQFNPEGLELSDTIFSTNADKQAVHAAANKLNEEIVGEGVVLLKNENNALPIATSATSKAKISVFGKNSANVVLGGSGSGGGNTEGSTSLYDGLRNANFELNPVLTEFYEGNDSGNGRPASPAIGATVTGIATGETPQSMYTNDVKNSYDEYNDAAIIVLSRLGGEGWDLPRLQLDGYNGKPVEGSQDGGQHYLEIDKNEEALIDEVIACGKFDKVIVLINCATSMELGFIEEKDIDAALWIGTLGGSGANAVGNVLNGTVNPSGHLVDTYARDFTKNPTWQNFGDNLRQNGNSYLTGGKPSQYHYVEYEEGIYVGYRYYETRSYQEIYRFGDDNGWYDENVVYPFGYGLSYTTFEWTLKDDATNKILDATDNNKISVTVNVKNTGEVAGKDVIQVYYSAPYIENGVEKAHVVLGGMVKTDLLQPGADNDYTVTIDIKDMASYDYSDANGNGHTGYELDAGVYTIYIGRDAHSCWADQDPMKVEYSVMDDIIYSMDIYGTDSVNDNRFQSMSDYMEGKTMSRASFNATFPTTPTEAESEMSDAVREGLAIKYDDENGAYAKWLLENAPGDATSEVVPQLYELIGADYNDERWEFIVNSLSKEVMAELISQGNFHTIAIPSINKPRTIDPDGPAGFTNFMGDPSVHDTCFYASECVIGATWNVDLANDMGVMVGLESLVGYTNEGGGRTYSGWYAPAVNIHRSPFSGRNWEYYSEDPFLTGSMGANVVIGAQSKGVYTYVKHFALNDQETDRDTNGLVTWADEQTFREIYLKPFQIIVEKGNTKAMMSSFNRIGTDWAGGSFSLLTEVLRMEWGFQGMVITDYNVSYSYMDSDLMIRAGGDLYLAQGYSVPSIEVLEAGMTNEVQLAAMKLATKNILYTVANSNAMNGTGEGVVWVTTMAKWKVALICVNVGLVVAAGVWGFFEIRRKLKKCKVQQDDTDNADNA